MQQKTIKERFLPVLDLDYYRSVNSDLRSLNDEELISHFDRWGKTEGRAGSPQSFREHFLSIISQTLDTLEIGPFCSPVLQGDKVRYFDIASREALIEKAIQLQYPFTEAPTIDYVSPNGDMDIIDERFDQVFSSHCVEHQPDLVRHFSQVSRILRDGGSYFLLVPDKRFCFDHYLAESTIADVLGAHIEQRRLHYAKSVLGQLLLTTHNEPVRHWQGDHGLPKFQQQGIECIKGTINHIVRNVDSYIDTHAWHCTPQIFEDIVTKIYQLGLSMLKADKVYNTPFGRFEFCAILSKE